MITGILQINANFIFCFRAKEKTKPQKIDGKTKPVEMGFMPIAGEEMLFEQTVNCLLLPKAGGVPTWRSDHVGERLMMKLPKQFEGIFAETKPLDEDMGRALAEWARGGVPAQRPATQAQTSAAPSVPHEGAADEPDSEEIESLDKSLGVAAALGTVALREAWDSVPAAARPILKVALDRRHKPAAIEADKGAA